MRPWPAAPIFTRSVQYCEVVERALCQALLVLCKLKLFTLPFMISLFLKKFKLGISFILDSVMQAKAYVGCSSLLMGRYANIAIGQPPGAQGLPVKVLHQYKEMVGSLDNSLFGRHLNDNAMPC